MTPLTLARRLRDLYEDHGYHVAAPKMLGKYHYRGMTLENYAAFRVLRPGTEDLRFPDEEEIVGLVFCGEGNDILFDGHEVHGSKKANERELMDIVQLAIR